MLSCYQPLIRHTKIKRIFSSDNAEKEQLPEKAKIGASPAIHNQEYAIPQDKMFPDFSPSKSLSSCSPSRASSLSCSPSLPSSSSNPSSPCDDSRVKNLLIMSDHSKNSYSTSKKFPDLCKSEKNSNRNGSSKCFSTLRSRTLDSISAEKSKNGISSKHHPNIVSTINMNVMSEPLHDQNDFYIDSVSARKEIALHSSTIKHDSKFGDISNIRATNVDFTAKIPHLTRRSRKSGSSKQDSSIHDSRSSSDSNSLQTETRMKRRIHTACVKGERKLPSLPAYCHSSCCCMRTMSKLSPRARISHVSHHPPLISSSTYKSEDLQKANFSSNMKSCNSELDQNLTMLDQTDLQERKRKTLNGPPSPLHGTSIKSEESDLSNDGNGMNSSFERLTISSENYMSKDCAAAAVASAKRRYRTTNHSCSDSSSSSSFHFGAPKASSNPKLSAVKSKSSSNKSTSIKNRSSNSSFGCIGCVGALGSSSIKECVKSSTKVTAAAAAACSVQETDGVARSSLSSACVSSSSASSPASPNSLFANLCSCSTLAHHYKALPHAPLILQNSPASLHAHTFRSLSHNVDSKQSHSQQLSQSMVLTCDEHHQPSQRNAASRTLPNENLRKNSSSQVSNTYSSAHHSLAKDILQELQKTLPRELANTVSSVSPPDRVVESVMFLCADENCLNSVRDPTNQTSQRGVINSSSGGYCILRGTFIARPIVFKKSQ